MSDNSSYQKVKPVSLPLKVWHMVWFKEKELYEQYYQAVDIDPYIEEFEAKLGAIRKIAFDPEVVDDPFVGEARALQSIREVLDK